MIALLALALLVAPTVESQEGMWPDEGDTIHVAATLKGLEAVQPVVGARMKYDIPPCKPLIVTKATPKKQRWATKDPVGGTETLEGDWLALMYKSEEECRERLAEAGEPEVKKSGETFRVSAGKPHGKPDQE